eukprot:1594141-Amphidinium_carterae.2
MFLAGLNVGNLTTVDAGTGMTHMTAATFFCRHRFTGFNLNKLRCPINCESFSTLLILCKRGCHQVWRSSPFHMHVHPARITLMPRKRRTNTFQGAAKTLLWLATKTRPPDIFYGVNKFDSSVSSDLEEAK